MKNANKALHAFALLLASALLATCTACAQPAASATSAAGAASTTSAAPSASASAAPEPEPAADGGYAIERRTRADETPMGEKDSWTIFVYMCGTDLETEGSMASFNLWELMQAPPADNVNIIVQTGGTRQWGKPMDAETEDVFGIEGDFATKAVDSSKLQRYKLTDEFTLVDEQPLASMGSQQTLYEFLSWGVANYPAEKMGVVFWDHGGGSLSGVCFDELFDYDSLLLFELDNAFGKLYDEMTDRFEFIGFDACLMATVEAANALAPYARYLYASEETEAGYGWDYTAITEALNAEPGMSGADLGKALCDGYYEFYQTLDDEASCTLSVTDLSRVDDVLYALNDLALVMDDGLEDPGLFAEVSRAVSRAESYYLDSMVDLGDIARHMQDVATEESAALLEALEEAVVYEVSGAGRAFATGLSIYYPTKVTTGSIAMYGTCYPTPSYFAYINALQYRKFELDLSGEQLVAVTQEPAPDAAGNYVMQVDPASVDYLREAGFQLFVADATHESAYLLGYDNDVLTDWDTGKIEDKFDGEWATLDGAPLMLTLSNFNDEYNMYHSPVMLNGARTNLILKWTLGAADYEILGTWGGVDLDTGIAERETRQLQPGDEVVPLYGVLPYDAVTSEELVAPSEYLDEEGNLVMTPGETVTVDADTAVTRGPLDAGEYLYQFAVIDVYGGLQTYVPITFNVDAAGAVAVSEGS